MLSKTKPRQKGLPRWPSVRDTKFTAYPTTLSGMSTPRRRAETYKPSPPDLRGPNHFTSHIYARTGPQASVAAFTEAQRCMTITMLDLPTWILRLGYGSLNIDMMSARRATTSIFHRILIRMSETRSTTKLLNCSMTMRRCLGGCDYLGLHSGADWMFRCNNRFWLLTLGNRRAVLV